MTELVINYPSQPVLVQLATALGLYDPIAKQLTTQGAIASGGSYFANIVGQVFQPTGATQPDQFGNPQPVMAALPGLWLRLRHNGDPAALQAKMGPQVMAQCAQLGVTIFRQYPDLGWSADGVTPAPAYVANIGVIA